MDVGRINKIQNSITLASLLVACCVVGRGEGLYFFKAF